MIYLIKVLIIVMLGWIQASGFKADIAFVLDSSGSIAWLGSSNWARVLNFTENHVSKLTVGPDDVRVAVMLFSDKASISFYLNSHETQTSVRSHIKDLINDYEGGSTNTQDALRLLVDRVFTDECGDRRDATNIGILLTDGESDTSKQQTVSEAERARRNDITLIAIGISNDDTGEIRGIASQPHERNYYIASDFQQLIGFVDRIVDAIEYVARATDECYVNPCLNGGVCIDDVGSYRCICSGTGYDGDRCQIGPSEAEHIVNTIAKATVSMQCGLDTAGLAYSWLVNGQSQSNGLVGSNSSTLIKPRVSSSDFGEYRCIVRKHGSVPLRERVFRLTEVEDSAIAATQYTATVGKGVQLICPLCKVLPEVNCVWSRGGDAPLRSSFVIGHDDTVAILKVEKQHFGEYLCKATYKDHKTATWVLIELSEKESQSFEDIIGYTSLSVIVVVLAVVVAIQNLCRRRHQHNGITLC